MFKKGEKYKRTDIHDNHGGQRQGGISTPSGDGGMIFLFTGDTGEQYGYRDGWRDDSVFLYTGEGQVGPMEFVRGNRAIRDHEKDGKELHLFSIVGKGFVQYEGQMRFVGFHKRTARDVNGTPRDVIVFELKSVSDMT